ncbi:MAG: hypothetical protein AABW64_02580 [Nanoarchaeota archaeon]
MEKQKNFFIAVIIVLSAVGIAGLMNPTITGDFSLYETPIPQQQILDEGGLSILGIKEGQKEVSKNVERVELRKWGGGFLWIYGDKSKDNDILEQIAALSNGAIIKVTHLEKKTKWNNVWFTEQSQVTERPKKRATPLKR